MDHILYEWDPAKAAQNLLKHGGEEDRWITIGSSRSGCTLFIAHAEREGRIRIISARTATRRETHAYEEGSI